MSHAVESMVYNTKVPWHGLGTLEPGLFTAEKALTLGGLDWEVKKHQVYININEHRPNLEPIFVVARDPEKQKVVDGKIEIIPGDQPFAIVRQDRGGVLTTSVTKQYKELQNRIAANLCETLTGSYGGARFETAGVLDHGRRVWFLVEIDAEGKYSLAGDTVKKYLLLTNGHDGKNSLICIVTPVRVVCQNTLNMALNGASRKFSSKHIGENMDQDVLNEVVREFLGLGNEYYAQMQMVADKLAVQKLSVAQRETVLDELFPKAEDASIKKSNAVDKARGMVLACLAKDDLADHVKTAWGLYNAVADYSDHYRTLKGISTRWGAENAYARTFEGTDLKDQTLELLFAMK